MPQIDVYLSSLVKYGASAIVLASGRPVTFRFPSGDRQASQVTPHADVTTLVEAIAPPAAHVALRAGRPTSFVVEGAGRTFEVGVDPQPGAWTVTIAPAAAPASVEEELPIERHQYELRPPRPREVRGSSPGAEGAVAALGGGEARVGGAARLAGEAMRVPATRGPGDDTSRGAASGEAPRAPVTPGRARLDPLLARMKELGASDLHLTTGMPPAVRLHGEIKILDDWPAFTAQELLDALMEIAPEKNRREFAERSDTDFAHIIPEVSRFRTNVFRDRRGPGGVFRVIPFQILTPEQIGLPKGVLELCYLTKGLVVVTGPTGSGKSTTLATLIDHVNQHRADHIITVEDPIEFVHENKRCLIHQREVHTHTRSFKDALRAALREDPDIVLVGEMRDLETIAIAVETAETGHLVFGTLHTTTAPSTVDRIIDQFPADRQEQIRQMLSESLRGVIAQTLCKKIGGGRVAAYEVLIGNNAVSNLIREGKTVQLFSMMQTGRAQGMITLGDSLMDLVKRGLVDPREAYMKAVNKNELKNLLAREGIKLALADA